LIRAKQFRANLDPENRRSLIITIHGIGYESGSPVGCYYLKPLDKVGVCS
jgi:hypothetical protein